MDQTLVKAQIERIIQKQPADYQELLRKYIDAMRIEHMVYKKRPEKFSGEEFDTLVELIRASIDLEQGENANATQKKYGFTVFKNPMGQNEYIWDFILQQERAPRNEGLLRRGLSNLKGGRKSRKNRKTRKSRR
jgi:hypothetical protein